MSNTVNPLRKEMAKFSEESRNRHTGIFFFTISEHFPKDGVMTVWFPADKSYKTFKTWDAVESFLHENGR